MPGKKHKKAYSGAQQQAAAIALHNPEQAKKYGGAAAKMAQSMTKGELRSRAETKWKKKGLPHRKDENCGHCSNDNCKCGPSCKCADCKKKNKKHCCGTFAEYVLQRDAQLND